MVRKMELHDRYTNLTTGLNALECLICNSGNEPLQIIDDLVDSYIKKISNAAPDLKTLQTFRTILSIKYQISTNSLDKDFPLVRKGLYIDITNMFGVDYDYQNREKLAVLCDIIVLQIVLRSDMQQLIKSFKDFHKSQEDSVATNDEATKLCLRVYECFTDSYNLYSYLYETKGEEDNLNELQNCILNLVKISMRKDKVEWKFLITLLPKMIVIFGTHNILPFLWNEIFLSSDDLGKTLAALCAIADICFPSNETKISDIHYQQCTRNELWLIIREGLTSMTYQQRKEALYLAKRAVDFIETHQSMMKNELKLSKKKYFVPFLCNRLEPEKQSIKDMKTNFFLILEVLEEKQKHLVIPALSHLQTLINAHADHKVCNDCFNTIWLQCIFQRILQHNNNAVISLGLTETLKADLGIFDNRFMDCLVNVLNNTLLCEVVADDQRRVPYIYSQLIVFFERSNDAGACLINKFIQAAAKISWAPVPLYFVIYSISSIKVEDIHDPWDYNDIDAMTILVGQTQKMPLSLRHSCLHHIVTAFGIYRTAESVDLAYIEKFLFPVLIHAKKLSGVWKTVRNSLLNMFNRSVAESYVVCTCESLFTIDRNLKSFAMMIAALTHTNLIFQRPTCLAKEALKRVFNKLNDADQRPYADKLSIIKVIELMAHLIDQFSNMWIQQASWIKSTILSYTDVTANLLIKSLGKNDSATVKVFLLLIPAMVNERFFKDSQLMLIEDKCIKVITNSEKVSKTQWHYAINVLYSCREKVYSLRPTLAKTYIPPLLKFCKGEMVFLDGTDETIEKTKLASDSQEMIGRLVHQSSVNGSLMDIWSSNVIGLQDLYRLVETENERVIEPVADMLCEVLKNSRIPIINDLDCFQSIISLSWRYAIEMKRSQIFFSAITKLMRLVMNSSFLKLDGMKTVAMECINQIMNDDNIPDVANTFLDSMSELNPQEALLFKEPLISCLLYGPFRRRDIKIEKTASLHDERGHSNTDPNIRVKSVVVLCKILDLPEATVIREHILKDLLEVLEQNRNKRYFDNSQLHRLKQRIMQTLLVMEPLLNKIETQILYDAISELLIAESNQQSVRLMQEWLLIRIYLKQPDMVDHIWSLFDVAIQKRPGCIVSLASIVFHVSRLLPDNTRNEYISKAISRLLPNCMGQQFSARLYSQVILQKVFDSLPRNSAETDKYREIYTGVKQSLQNGNMAKKSVSTIDNFFLNTFDPIYCYNLKTIYYDLPRLTNVSFDEWDALFFILNIRIVKPPKFLLFEVNDILENATAMIKSSRPTGDLSENTDLPTDDCSGLSDIQKKIIPWKSMIPVYDDISEIPTNFTKRQCKSDQTGLIVVASLIDRPANLGGIARTCEILGAKELIIGSLKYVEDREFQALSVSAEKWITITEVKPHLLQKYLLEQQSAGWKLIGAEQTANSRNLLEMEFDKKTILLLGNEKTGIPANLIPHLDICVEIPQKGVVRSLNVHVTGAICIWQYAKQHVFS